MRSCSRQCFGTDIMRHKYTGSFPGNRTLTQSPGFSGWHSTASCWRSCRRSAHMENTFLQWHANHTHTRVCDNSCFQKNITIKVLREILFFPFKSAVCISAPLAESIIWKFRVGKLFCIFERMLTKAVFIWCNKNSNILKYYYHLKELFSIWMHFKM